jgi:serine phosphatase RsbU (regulator of sigma subunit)/transcriptional regulator with GAF, ATPase, and Fis domain
MSLQPLPLSSNDADLNKWHELFKLAEIFTSKFTLESQITYLTNIFEQNISCKASLWLSASFSDLLKHEGLENNRTLLRDLSPLMDEAYNERRIMPKLQSTSMDVYSPMMIAIPLMIEDDILGIIQLEKIGQVGFSIHEFEFSLSLGIQYSMALNQSRQKTHSHYLQQSIAQITSIEEISKSIMSNLDRDSLLNSVLSLVHQKYGFTKTRIYTVRGGDKRVLKQIGITDDGLEPEKLYYYEKDAGPLSWSISRLEPIVINNTSLDDQFSPSSFEKNIQSELVIPLLNGELLVGVLELCSNSVDTFDPDTIKGFQYLSQNIALAIRNANLYRSEHMRRLMYDRLLEVVGSISAEVSVDDVLQNLLDVLEEILPWDAAAIWLIDSSGNETGIGQFTSSLRLAATQIKEQFSEETDQIHSLENNTLFDKYIQNSVDANDLLSIYPWISENINGDTPEIRNSASTYEPLGAILGFKSDYSALGAPLIINKQPIGMIVLAHHLTDQYSYESQSVAIAFTNYASIAIENIRLYAAAHDQAWISTVLLQVAEATQSITNIDELLETVVGMFPGLIGVDACTIFLWDQSIEAFFPKASNGFDAEQLARLDTWDIYPGSVIAFDQLKQSKTPVILTTDTLSDDIEKQIFPNYDFSKDLLILFPLTTQNSLCGAILIDFTNSTLEINSSQEVWNEKYTLIQGTARQTAVAIENLQLIKSQEEEAYISVALLQVAQAIVSLNQLDEILGSIVRITPILVGVKRCIIYLWDSKDLVFRQSELFGFSKNDLIIMGQVIKANEFPFIETIQQSNQIVYHPLGPANSPVTWNEIAPGDTFIVEGFAPDSDEEISIKLDSRSFINHERLLIGFPLSVKGEILGAMLIEEEDPIKGSLSLHIREKRIEIVKGITQQAAIAIKNELLQQEAVKSERMERELQLAREIQTTFLPDRLPELPGWDIGARWQPARQVGGDFYDILILDDDRIGFVIADVADKGMPAALFMTLIRTLIRAAAKEKLSPASVLKQVNELLIPDSKHGMFVTVFYGVFSLNSGIVVYANAGHNPPIVKQINRAELIELTRTSIALGIFEDIEVEERELCMNPGDWILLYTDGITEAFSAKEEIFGTERLFNLLVDYKFISSDELLDRIEGSVNEFITGTDLSDDMTLATIFRKLP